MDDELVKGGDSMISMIVTLLLLGVLIYVVQLIVSMLALPSQVKTIVYIIIGVLVLLYLLNMFGLYNGQVLLVR
jgi:hypothetical protein